MTKDYTATEKKIRELVPRLMELSFGCRISVSDMGVWGHPASNYTYRIIDERNNEDGKVLDKIYLCSSRGWSHDEDSGFLPKKGFPDRIEIHNSFKKGVTKVSGHKYNDFKIIGHKIYLDAVLEALAVSDAGYRWSVYSNGTMIELENEVTGLKFYWKYGKDFSRQSEETKQFIESLLK